MPKDATKYVPDNQLRLADNAQMAAKPLCDRSEEAWLVGTNRQTKTFLSSVRFDFPSHVF